MWRETTQHERNRKIFREELDSFLPDRILDFHVHLLNEGVLPEGEALSCAGHPIDKYEMSDLEHDLEDSYPGRETYAVCMGWPVPQYDRAKNNEYIVASCKGQRFFPLRLYAPRETDMTVLEEEIVNAGFIGLKPYPRYVEKPAEMEVEIHEMFPPAIGDLADRLGLIVMMHIPRKGRLADPVNQKQIVEVCEKYPNARFVLAHIGRAYFLKNIVGHLDKLVGLPNLYYDLAMLNNWEVLEYLFRSVSREKILYATDTPIALAPGKSIEINDQYTYVTPVPWELSISDDHKKVIFTSFLYEELRAIKKAMKRLSLGDDFAEGIFFENGWGLLCAARR